MTGSSKEASAAELFTQMFQQHTELQAPHQDLLMDPGPIIRRMFFSFPLTSANGPTYGYT